MGRRQKRSKARSKSSRVAAAGHDEGAHGVVHVETLAEVDVPQRAGHLNHAVRGNGHAERAADAPEEQQVVQQVAALMQGFRPAARERRSWHQGGVGLRLDEGTLMQALQCAVVQQVDVILILENDAQGFADRLQRQIALVEGDEGRRPVQGFGDARRLEELQLRAFPE